MVPHIILVIIIKILIILIKGDMISLYYVKFGNSSRDFDEKVLNFGSIRHIFILPKNIY